MLLANYFFTFSGSQALPATVYTDLDSERIRRFGPPNPPILMLLANLTIGYYRQFWGTFEAPQPPTLGEHELKVPQNWGI